jgi:hypothetical protein
MRQGRRRAQFANDADREAALLADNWFDSHRTRTGDHLTRLEIRGGRCQVFALTTLNSDVHQSHRQRQWPELGIRRNTHDRFHNHRVLVELLVPKLRSSQLNPN